MIVFLVMDWTIGATRMKALTLATGGPEAQASDMNRRISGVSKRALKSSDCVKVRLDEVGMIEVAVLSTLLCVYFQV